MAVADFEGITMNRLYTLYCGGQTPHGIVSDQSFRGFLADIVTPRFDGFTVRTGVGYWKGEPEPCREIVILGDDDDRYAIYSVARSYANRFEQESVLVTTAELLSGDFVL